jgi:hypothetical protein
VEESLIPFHIRYPGLEYKAERVFSSDEILSIAETEIKGIRGLMLEGLMTTYSRDFYKDLAALTPMLKESTEYYFEKKAYLLYEHGQNPKVGRRIIGHAFDHEYKDEGIKVWDFMPEPVSESPDSVKYAYESVQRGEKKGFSVGAIMWRDTGLHTPPGIIIDWDIEEHSACSNPVNTGAKLHAVVELKSLQGIPVEEADLDEFENSLSEGLAEYKAGRVLSVGNEKKLRNAHMSIGEVLGQLDPMPEKQYGKTGTTKNHTAIEQFKKERKAQMPPEDINKTGSEGQGQVEKLMAELEATRGQLGVLMTAHEKIEADRRAAEMEIKARQEAETIALKEKAATEKETAEFNSKVESYLTQIRSNTRSGYAGPVFTAPMLNGMTSMNGGWGTPPSAPSTFGPNGQMQHVGRQVKMTMSGPVLETKGVYDDDTGRQLPDKIIDWLFDVKFNGARAEHKSISHPAAPTQALLEEKNMVAGYPTNAASTPAGSAGGFALPVAYLNDIVPYLVDRGSIRDYITVLPAEALVLEVPKETQPAVAASVVAPGTSKPTVDYGTDLVEVRQYCIPMIVNVTNQLLRYSRGTAERMLREKLSQVIRLSEFKYALTGTGTGQPFGIIPALTAANTADPTGFYSIVRGAGTDPAARLY